jgi:carbonic anhydrase/acetyltransferase-like protein (isoleucine patch superfamily)
VRPVDSGLMEIRHGDSAPSPRHSLRIGDHVLAGPHSYLTGCTFDDEVFIATGAMVFNGAQMGRQHHPAIMVS